MKKNSVTPWLLFMLSVVFMTFTACSKDDDNDVDNNSGSSLIVGTWSCDHHYLDGYSSGTPATIDTYVFYSDNTYKWTCKSWDDQSGTYVYNEQTRTLTIYEFNRNRTYYVLNLTQEYLVIMDQDGDSYTYTRR